jgi:hypothetical protein
MTTASTLNCLPAAIDSGVHTNAAAAAAPRHHGALFGLAIGTFAVGTEGLLISAEI